MEITEANKWLTTEETAMMIGVTPKTLRNWRCTNRQPSLPYYKLSGNFVRYLESDVIKFINSKLHAPSPPAQ